MKLWQFEAIFRDEKELVINELSYGNWSDIESYYKDWESLIKNHRREILDLIIPQKLLISVSNKSKKIIFVDKSEKIIRSFNTNSNDEKMLISEAVNLLDHDTIEEVFEKMEAKLVYNSSPPW